MQALPPQLHTQEGDNIYIFAKAIAQLPLPLFSCSSSDDPSVCFQKPPVQPKSKKLFFIKFSAHIDLKVPI
jgi:hypothetical protein